MAQKLALSVDTKDAFEGGEKLLAHDLHELGLDEDVEHMNISFDNDKTVHYWMTSTFLLSLASIFYLPFYILFWPCMLWGARRWAESRKAVVTDRQLVLKQGRYSCCCMCWNESTKSIPLDKITDLQMQQGCVQRCFDIQEIRVETASATSDMPELRLVGLHNARATRAKILDVRDHRQVKDDAGGYNPLLASQQNQQEQMQQTMSAQHDTMLQIKDVLQEMRNALVSMDNKMSADRDVDAQV
mmetsp:Transcript_57941/g.96095  ORF Transcript_57941/g.96095 Transcript_57941/m.96095 type:complete len:243 (+) Transcript_57941:53-781(+)|eukprot:CAMPEP_0202708496 /NCGR_PEP_ID=MMETSP1385-20130828/20689_1 /ASSEMBLY_ACC=CAM_ASM_000861 /TAXON_ID=933848 /ORGANISM="Elphidium margaritaceum" /LENGTH=242 /DNA_ID=CAMNT_0049367481 /DNA_START=35 /DNA_END=763 /DNA_ORIENTATION=-